MTARGVMKGQTRKKCEHRDNCPTWLKMTVFPPVVVLLSVVLTVAVTRGGRTMLTPRGIAPGMGQ